MSWRFKLVGDDMDLRFLSGLFPAHGDVRVLETGGEYALEADALDNMTGDQVARLKVAEPLLAMVNGWALTQDLNQTPVRLSGQGTDENGTPFAVAFAGTGTATARGIAFVTTVTIDGVPQIQPALGASLATEAAIDQALSDLLTLIGSHPHDFYTLYKVHEIIEDETPGGLNPVWTTTNDESERFTCAANNRGASGLSARHATTTKPPAKLIPMTLDESRQYVLRLANSFLRWVADGRPSL
jgi:hypothetical protein